jgi:hypothetical protein
MVSHHAPDAELFVEGGIHQTLFLQNTFHYSKIVHGAIQRMAQVLHLNGQILNRLGGLKHPNKPQG